MGDQIVALEDEAHGVVAVGVPVPGGVFFRGDPVDDELALVVAVQAADDVEQRGLAGAAGAQDGHKLVVPQAETHPVQGPLHQAPVLYTSIPLICNMLRTFHPALTGARIHFHCIAS